MPYGEEKTLEERQAESKKRHSKRSEWDLLGDAADRNAKRQREEKKLKADTEIHERRLKRGARQDKEFEREKEEIENSRFGGRCDPRQLVVFGLHLLGISNKEIARQTGASYPGINKSIAIYEKQFYGDKAVQAAIKGAKARLMGLLEPAIESVKYHVTNFSDTKNYEAAKDILTSFGVFAAQKEGDQTVNIAIIDEERRKNLSHSLQTFGYEVKDVPGNGDKPVKTQTKSRLPDPDQSEPD